MRLAPLVIVIAACGSNKPVAPRDAAGDADAASDATLARVSVQALTADLDLLFMIDNSASTNDKQTVFAANFPKFVQALDSFPAGRPNLHIGVISSTVDIGTQGFGPGCPSPNVNEDGRLQNTPRVTGCSPPTGRFISDILNSTGGRTTNYSGTLDQAFSCIAQLGATGCGFEEPLESMKRALDGSHPENAGFVRAGALLAVVMVTDEDDCSATDTSLFSLSGSAVGPGDFRCQPLYAYSCDTPISATGAGTYTGCVPRLGSYLGDPAAYYQFLTSIKPAGELALALVIGDPKLDGSGKATIMTGPITTPFNQTLALLPSCTTTINGNPAIGRPGIRLASFMSNFAPSRSREYTICQSDYSAALTDIGAALAAATSPCIQDAIDTTDTDGTNAGVQLGCTVTDSVNGGTPTTVPACTMMDATTVAASSPSPCWWSAADSSACPATSTHFLIHIQRSAPAVGVTTLVTCPLAP